MFVSHNSSEDTANCSEVVTCLQAYSRPSRLRFARFLKYGPCIPTNIYLRVISLYTAVLKIRHLLRFRRQKLVILNAIQACEFFSWRKLEFCVAPSFGELSVTKVPLTIVFTAISQFQSVMRALNRRYLHGLQQCFPAFCMLRPTVYFVKNFSH